MRKSTCNIAVYSDGFAGNFIRDIEFPFIKCDVDGMWLRGSELHQRLLDHVVMPSYAQFQDYQVSAVILPEKILVVLHFLPKMSGMEKGLIVGNIDGQRAAASGTEITEIFLKPLMIFSSFLSVCL